MFDFKIHAKKRLKMHVRFQNLFILGDSYQCWAYSTTSMLRHSMANFTLEQMDEAVRNGTWDGKYGYQGKHIFDKEEELNYIRSNEVFVEMRNSMLMTIVPKKMTQKDKGQAAYLRAAISRVSF